MFLLKNLPEGEGAGIIELTFSLNDSKKGIKRWKHEKEKTYAVQPRLPHHGVRDGGADDGKRSDSKRSW